MNYACSYDLFPQLESISVNEQSYNDMLQSNQQMYYNQQHQAADQDSLYYYYQQLAQQQQQQQHQQHQQQQSILDSKDILFPTLPEQPVYTQCTDSNSNYPGSMPQQKLSPNSNCYGGESPYSIGSDSFHYGQQAYNNYYYHSYQLTPSVSSNSTIALSTPPLTQQGHDAFKVQTPSFHQPTLPSPMLDAMSYNDVPVKEEKNAFTPSPSCSSYTSDDNEETEDDEEEEDTATTVQGGKSTTLFHCEFKGCTKTFTRTYNLKSHRRTHTDEKPFTCNLCPKAFARQHDRNRHAKLHLGLKPYPCQFCEKSFARQDALNRHLKRDKKNTSAKGGAYMYPPPCLLIKLRQQQMAAMKKRKQQQH